MADRNRNNWSLFLFKCSFFMIISVILPMVAFPSSSPSNKTQAANPNAMEVIAPPLKLSVDQQAHARIFCNNFIIIPSFGEFFEFYERSLINGRERIFKGPWGGSFRENTPVSYSLTGNDPSSEAEYAVSYKQIDAWTIELRLSFKTPSRTSSLGFDIVKLSSDLFKGGVFAAMPTSVSDAQGIPVEPRSLENRMLLNGKNRILVRGTLSDIEIMDMMDGKSMYAADGRNVPWDKNASIIFGAEAKDLTPGSRHDFRYVIRSLPPSRPEATELSSVTFSLGNKVNAWSFFSIPPKIELKMSGSYKLKAHDVISGAPSGTAETVMAKGIKQVTSMDISMQVLKTGSSGSGIFFERASRTARSDIPPEGFEIVTTPDKVIVRGVEERGCLYGAYALLGLIARKDGEWEIDCGTIRDWPDLPVRGGCLELLSPAIRDVEIMKRYLDAYSRARSNVIIFLHDPKQVLSWLGTRDDGGWTKEQMAEIARYARWLHMDVWGGMGSGFRKQDFPEMEINEGANLYNPSKEKNYHYLFSLYDEILKTYEPSTMLISHDEIQGLSVYASESGLSSAEILADDVRRIRDWLEKKNVRTAMWGDMLLAHEMWDSKVGSANSQNPFFRSGATHLAIQLLPKDIFILDWHYDERKDYESIGYFRQNGFHVAGAPWHDSKVAQLFAGSVKRYGGQGLIATDWGFWRTLSPAATTLCAPLCGWKVDYSMETDDSDIAALAYELRDPIYHNSIATEAQHSVPLESVCDNSTYDSAPNEGVGVFDLGSVLDLRFAPIGRLDINGVLFELHDSLKGEKKNCVVLVHDNNGKVPKSEIIRLPVSEMKATGLAFLHTCYVKEPQYRSRKLGEYVVEFENGATSPIDLIEGYNITDVRSSVGIRSNAWSFFRSPDILIGSELAWRGQSANGIPLNLQKLIWKNPFPELKIKSISIQCSDIDEYFRIALLAVTILNEAPKDLLLSPPTSPTVLTNPER
ncbi:Glycoside hydrolase, family 20 [uncultured Desulfobacterium sp.]|uniref:Glycoside hydrolase, family 20 n=1 Tax=uncultured Desulfobacterium sp. TaxID=201089 RepID=A0A445MUU5_9BACT|nr:Glycoside hydrolase, family 20 [uncultured Desulfobacterium sp.]